MDKLTIVESCDTVQVEAVQANHVTVGTLEDQDRAPAETEKKPSAGPPRWPEFYTGVAWRKFWPDAAAAQPQTYPLEGDTLNTGDTPWAVWNVDCC